jgi:hypothetical protein
MSRRLKRIGLQHEIIRQLFERGPHGGARRKALGYPKTPTGLMPQALRALVGEQVHRAPNMEAILCLSVKRAMDFSETFTRRKEYLAPFSWKRDSCLRGRCDMEKLCDLAMMIGALGVSMGMLALIAAP